LIDLAVFADGDRVALFCRPHTVVTSSAPAAERFTVRDGKITETVLVFDRLSFGAPGARDAPRPGSTGAD
jgi:hypothetical protein